MASTLIAVPTTKALARADHDDESERDSEHEPNRGHDSDRRETGSDLVSEEDAEERAGQDGALEADVEIACPARGESADRREQ